jgi:hypothetical protein
MKGLSSHRLAVRGIHGRIGEAEAGVQLHLPVIAEPVERPVHQVLELAQVGDAEILQRRERKDVVRLGSRKLGKGSRGFLDRRAGGGTAAGPRRARSPPVRLQRAGSSPANSETLCNSTQHTERLIPRTDNTGRMCFKETLAPRNHPSG